MIGLACCGGLRSRNLGYWRYPDRGISMQVLNSLPLLEPGLLTDSNWRKKESFVERLHWHTKWKTPACAGRCRFRQDNSRHCVGIAEEMDLHVRHSRIPIFLRYVRFAYQWYLEEEHHWWQTERRCIPNREYSSKLRLVWAMITLEEISKNRFRNSWNPLLYSDRVHRRYWSTPQLRNKRSKILHGQIQRQKEQ